MNRPAFAVPSALRLPRGARLSLILVAPALLSACASAGQFPSLAKGPNELAAEGRISACGIPVAGPARVAATPPAPVAEQSLPTDLAQRIAALGDAARHAHQAFADKQGRTSAAVTKGAGSSRDSAAWSLASLALADLTSARSQTAVPLAELDQLYNARRVDGGDGVAIAAVRDQVTAWVADEDAVLAELAGRLGG